MNKTAAERFHDKYTRGHVGGCWLWTGRLTSRGYGRFFSDGKPQRAHRYSYEHFVRPIPEGLFVCHHCDTPNCVNPAHLFLGTSADNMRDMKEKGRSVGRKPGRSGRSAGSRGNVRGEACPNAKLDDEKVRAIRADTRLHREIAADYGVDRRGISRIKRREAWKHVT